MPAVDVIYYTDPLCSWSWAFEPVWRRLRYELGDQLAWRYRMGGMIPDWRHYADPLNDVASPAHVGPQWLEVSRLSGMPIEPRIWHDDPPASSYPACLAVKAAELQGRGAGERYLRRAREAVMLEQRNIARRSVLLELAEELSGTGGRDAAGGEALDVEAFSRALDDGDALAALRADLQDVKYREIGRFPTLVVRGREARGVVIVGYRPYAVLLEAVRQVAGTSLAIGAPAPTAAKYAAFWRSVTGRLTAREIAAVCGAGADASTPDSEAIA